MSQENFLGAKLGGKMVLGSGMRDVKISFEKATRCQEQLFF
jgi:hypothetical protein